MPPRKDLTGQIFGGWKVVAYSHTDKHGKSCWQCLCVCGNIKTVVYGNLINYATSSCGCHRKELMTGDGLSSARALYNAYRWGARKRKYTFELTFEQFYKMTQQNCVLCGKIPNTTYHAKNCSNTFIYNGIDRRDNSIGYTLENCQTCCTVCNYGKGKLTHDQYIDHCRAVVEHNKG